MRHYSDHRKLGRTTSHRRAMLSNLVSSLIEHDRVETTLPKAKEARRVAEKIVTLSKKGSLHARRLAISLLRNQHAVDIAFASFSKRFDGRSGGYTRIYRLGSRHGDAAPMAILEYLRETKEAAGLSEKKAKQAKGEKKPGVGTKLRQAAEKVVRKKKTKKEA